MVVYYWIASIGVCFIFKYGSILESFRIKTSSLFPFLEKLYKCCLCMGFWVGLIMTPFLHVIEGFDIELIWFPFSCSGLCWITDSLLNLIHSLTILINKIIDED